MQQRLEGIQIVCIDDHEDTLEILRYVLGIRGAVVYTATTASAGGALAAGMAAGVVIVDLSLPDEDGVALIQRLRRLESFQAGKAQIVALTASCTEHDRQAALSAGAAWFIPKPFDEEELAACVRSLATDWGMGG